MMSRFEYSPLRAVLSAGFFFLCTLAVRAADPTRNFAVPAGEAGETLRQFADQAGQQVVYLANEVRGVRTSPVQGEFTVRAGLDRLLTGTELVAKLDEPSGTLAVSRAATTKAPPESNSVEKKARGEGKASGASETPLVLDAFNVSSAALSLRRAIAEKRGTLVVSDGVSADEIGSIPDFGLGEALERVPGVSMIINNGRGESQFATLRGLNADYNSVVIDGLQLPSTETSRRNVSLDVIPSSLAKNLSVYKTFTPEMDGNAIGGLINLGTRSAFDNPGFFLSARGNYGIYENERRLHRRTPSGQGELTVSRTFGTRGQHGLVLSASYFRRDSSSLNSAIDTYSFYNAAGTKLALNDPAVATAIPTPDRRRWLSYDNLRERNGLFGKYEFAGAGGLRAHLTGGFFQHTNDEERQSNILIQNTAAAGTPVFTSANSATVGSANAQTDYAAFYQDRRIIYGEAGIAFTPTPESQVEFTAHYAVGDYHQDTRLDTYRIANTTSLAYAYDFTPGAMPYFGPVNEAFYYSAANYRQFEHGTASDDNDEKILTLDLNYGRNARPDDQGLGFKTGVKFRGLDRTYDRGEENYRPTSTLLTLADALDPRLITPYNGRGQHLVLIDPVLAQKVFEANRGLYPLNSASLTNNLQSDYTLTETVSAAYAEALYRLTRFTAIGGVRYESTDLKTGSNLGTTKAGVTTFTPVSQRNAYRDLLPSLNAYYDLAKNLWLRAAASRSLSRPNYDSLAARTVVTDNSAGAVSIATGNPALKPRRSDNYDASLEWYFSRDGILSAAVFRKNIRDEFLRLSSSETSVVNGLTTVTTTTAPRNLDHARIDGVELGLTSTRLRFLPGPLSGFGLQTNLTVLKIDTSSILMADGTVRKLPSLLESAKSTFNTTLLYGLGKFSAQVSYKRTGPQLVSIATDSAVNDRFYLANETYDAQLRYKFNARWSVTLQAKNFTNERPTRVIGLRQELLREELDNGRSWFAGVNYTNSR